MKKLICLVGLILNCLFALAADNDGWTITATQRDNYAGITMANGRIGIISSEQLFQVKEIVMNGVFDKFDGYIGVSTTAYAPSFVNLNVSMDGKQVTNRDIQSWKQTLDMKKASLVTTVETQDATFEYSLMALRNLPYAGMMIVDVTPKKDVTMNVVDKIAFHATHSSPSYNLFTITEGKEYIPLLSVTCNTRNNSNQVSSSSTFVFEDKAMYHEVKKSGNDGTEALQFTKKLTAGKTFRFAVAGACGTHRDFIHPANESQRVITTIVCNGLQKTLNGHYAQWDRIWQGDIQIEGDEESQRDVRSALYHLYSFGGEDTRLSIAPMGLSGNGYNSHVFWDTEIWMYPPLLLLNQAMAKSCVDYRFDRMEKAESRAKMYGYNGVMFPWESDDTGEEACPIFALTGALEHHITADIAIACWNYYRVTRDKDWLSKSGYPLLKKVAEFFMSRCTRNADGTYSIENVVGADEYAINVDDNAFTNGAAKVAFDYVILAAKELGVQPDTRWADYAQHIKFHYFADGVMKEFASYNGELVKQGDVTLLTYPLGIVTDPKEVRKNLEYYHAKIDPIGPAMGNSISSILYSQLGDAEKAYELFKKCYIPHKCPPFGVLSESAGGNNPYFATGAGGMLQVVLNGFGGLRITDKGITQVKTTLPKKWKKLTITGVGPEKKTYVVENH